VEWSGTDRRRPLPVEFFPMKRRGGFGGNFRDSVKSRLFMVATTTNEIVGLEVAL
jgi:hypothetical protein